MEPGPASESPVGFEIDDEVYRDHRKHLVELGSESLRTFDRAILTLSSGALGISLTFVNMIVPGSPSASYLVVISWLGYVISIVTNLISYQLSWLHSMREVEVIDEVYSRKHPYTDRNARLRRIINISNLIALVVFVISTFFLCAFVWENL
jgi:hypothetical protein